MEEKVVFFEYLNIEVNINHHNFDKLAELNDIKKEMGCMKYVIHKINKINAIETISITSDEDSDISIIKNEFIMEKDNIKYYTANYAGFNVIMNDYGYINASDLCLKGNKRLVEWSKVNKRAKSNETEELIRAVQESLFMDLTQGEFIKIIKTGDIVEPNDIQVLYKVKGNGKGEIAKIQGTYAHPLLIPHIATWISKKFGVAVSKIVNNYIVNEHKKSIALKDKKIKSLDSTIIRLENKIDKLSEQNNTLLKKVDGLNEQNNTLLEKVDGLNDQNNMLIDKVSNISDLANNIAPHITFFKCFMSIYRIKSSQTPYNYYVIKGLIDNEMAYINKYENLFINEGGLEEIITVKCIDAVHLYNNYRDKMFIIDKKNSSRCMLINNRTIKAQLTYFAQLSSSNFKQNLNEIYDA